MRWLSILICSLGLAALTLDSSAVEAPDERVAAYRQFRSAFDAGNFTAALPPAAQVVELTRRQFGSEAPELANPLTNLATTYLRMGEHGMALDSYREALTLLDLLGDTINPKLVAPLHGIGLALRGLTRDAEAVAPLKRAVDITRNRSGLYSEAQLPMLQSLIDCYENTGRVEDATREHQYAYTVAETAYGRNDLRLLAPLDRYARWHESTGRYAAARALHARAVEIADAAQPNSLLAIDGLRGIARAYRLAFINAEAEDVIASVDALPSNISNSASARMFATSPNGNERTLRIALQRLDATPDDHAALRGAVLTDLGDWYLTAGESSRAVAAYRDAWRALATAGDTSSLAKPVAVVYRAPAMAVSRKREDPEEYSEQVVELRLSIAATGEVRAVSVANPAPEREAAERALTGVVRRALWRPAFSNGEPVASTDFIFTERVNVRRPPPTN
jgi:tetratricopeptide (TPR) repeat protein